MNIHGDYPENSGFVRVRARCGPDPCRYSPRSRRFPTPRRVRPKIPHNVDRQPHGRHVLRLLPEVTEGLRGDRSIFAFAALDALLRRTHSVSMSGRHLAGPAHGGAGRPRKRSPESFAASRIVCVSALGAGCPDTAAGVGAGRRGRPCGRALLAFGQPSPAGRVSSRWVTVPGACALRLPMPHRRGKTLCTNPSPPASGASTSLGLA